MIDEMNSEGRTLDQALIGETAADLMERLPGSLEGKHEARVNEVVVVAHVEWKDEDGDECEAVVFQASTGVAHHTAGLLVAATQHLENRNLER